MTTLIVDKRIVESVLKAVPTKDKGVNHSRALKITEGGWLLAFAGDNKTGFIVRIAVDKDNANRAFDARAEIEPGFYSRDALARWVHPMGGETPEPLTEDEKKHSYLGAVSGLNQILEPFAVDDLGHRETVADPEELMLPLLNLTPALKIKCAQARTPKQPPSLLRPSTWAGKSGPGAPLACGWLLGTLTACARSPCPYETGSRDEPRSTRLHGRDRIGRTQLRNPWSYRTHDPHTHHLYFRAARLIRARRAAKHHPEST